MYNNPVTDTRNLDAVIQDASKINLHYSKYPENFPVSLWVAVVSDA